MIAALLAAALQAAAAVAAPAPASSAPPRPTASVPTSDADLSAPSADGLESLRQAYHDSCEVRVYGEYDDMCSAMSDQIRHYRAALAKAQRRARPR